VAVDPPTLLPLYGAGGAPVSMKVDYGYAIELDKEEIAKAELVWTRRELAEADDVAPSTASESFASNMMPSLGPSTLPFLRRRPLFCNIELEKETTSSDPRTQGAVWSSANLSHW